MTPTAPAPVSSSPASGLGGANAIQARMASAFSGEAAPAESKPAEVSKAPAETKQAAPVHEKAPKQDTSFLPGEKELATKEKVEQKAETKEDKRGTDGMTSTERKALLEYKAKAESAESRIKDLEEKSKELEITTKERNELKALVEERAKLVEELEAKASAYDVRASRQYQESIGKPMEQIAAYVENVCKSQGIDADAVFNALQIQDEFKSNAELSEYVASMDAFNGDKFRQALSALRDLGRKHVEAMSRSTETMAAIKESEAKELQEKQEKEKSSYKVALTKTVDALKDRYSFLKDDEVAKDILESAESVDFAALKPEERAYYASAGHVALRFNSVLKEKDAKIAELESALKKHTRTPGPAGVTSTPQSTDKPEVAGKSTGERFAATFFG